MTLLPALSLSRRSFSVGGCSTCGPHFCGMSIAEDARRYAKEKGLSDSVAIKEALKEKAAELAQVEGVCQKV